MLKLFNDLKNTLFEMTDGVKKDEIKNEVHVEQSDNKTSDHYVTHPYLYSERNNIPIISDVKKLTIYILELESGKYYIGKTYNPDFRISDHFASVGSAWTTQYKPIKVVSIINDCDAYDEDKWTVKYMAKYGIDNVRGGSFCEVVLKNKDINFIRKMIDGANDNCYKCGKSGHFAKHCYSKKYCIRCLRYGHLESTCYFNTDVDGLLLDNSVTELLNCTKCGRKNHIDADCTVVLNDNIDQIDSALNSVQLSPKSVGCVKCGRKNHTEAMCYAKSHINDVKLVLCNKCGRNNHVEVQCYAKTHINGRLI